MTGMGGEAGDRLLLNCRPKKQVALRAEREGKAKSEGENGSRHEVAGQSVIAFVVQVVAWQRRT